MRFPRLSLYEAWAHLFAAWALLVVALFLFSGALRSVAEDEDRDG